MDEDYGFEYVIEDLMNKDTECNMDKDVITELKESNEVLRVKVSEQEYTIRKLQEEVEDKTLLIKDIVSYQFMIEKLQKELDEKTNK